MAKADVTTLVSSLAVAQVDATAVSDFYDRIVFEHGLQRESLTNAAYVAVVQGTQNYSLPSSAIRGLGVFYDDTWLHREDKRGAEVSDHYWRNRQQAPRAYLLEDADQYTFDVVPVPDRSGDSVGVATPFTTFPAGNLTIIYTDNAANVQAWEELPVACEILAREFGRDSDNRDEVASGMWRQLASIFFGMIDA